MKNKENLQKLQQEQAKKMKEDETNRANAKEIKKNMDKVVIQFNVKTGEGDKVFGSISVKQIKEELAKLGYKIEKSQIEITSPISALGFHTVNIILYPNIISQIKIHLVK